jgi:hypothetical protein
MNDLKVGPLGSAGSADGTYVTQRASRVGNQLVANGQGWYAENATRGLISSMTLTAWTTNISAGNLLGATAAASTQFALWNPAGSGVNISLLKFSINITSGTTPISGIWHGVGSTAPTIASATAAAPASYIGSNNALVASYAGKAGYLTHATGSALTGASAPRATRLVGLNITAGTYANLAGVAFMDMVDGDIVLPPNTFWVPLWAAQGTTVLGGYSITWEEIPI